MRWFLYCAQQQKWRHTNRDTPYTLKCSELRDLLNLLEIAVLRGSAISPPRLHVSRSRYIVLHALNAAHTPRVLPLAINEVFNLYFMCTIFGVNGRTIPDTYRIYGRMHHHLYCFGYMRLCFKSRQGWNNFNYYSRRLGVARFRVPMRSFILIWTHNYAILPCNSRAGFRTLLSKQLSSYSATSAVDVQYWKENRQTRMYYKLPTPFFLFLYVYYTFRVLRSLKAKPRQMNKNKHLL